MIMFVIGAVARITSARSHVIKNQSGDNQNQCANQNRGKYIHVAQGFYFVGTDDGDERGGSSGWM